MTAGTRASVSHPADIDLVKRVDATLRGYLEQRSEELERVHESVALAGETLRDFVLNGGKRVRPTFAWWGWRGAGGDPDGAEADSVLRAISALELVQANALLHDDVMDGSNTRRGRPTAHVAFTARHRDHGWLGRPGRFGESAAILLGDLALAWADDMFHGAGLDVSAHHSAQPVWAGMRTEMMGGQYLDLWVQATGEQSTDAALRVCRFKTAAYTIERPLHLGAALGGAPAELVQAYRRFGADIGVAFQLRDDLLGVFGDPVVTGKPAGDDIREGKRTLLLALAIGSANRTENAAAQQELTAGLGDAQLDDDGVDRIRTVLEDLGAVAEVERRITRLTETAMAALTAAAVTEPAASRLTELADEVTRRAA